MRLLRQVLFSLIFIVAISSAGTADARGFVFNFKNVSGSPLEIQIYSDTRPFVWPAQERTWILPPDGRAHSEKIICTPHEKVCFGAWIPGREDINYGVARHKSTTCTSCCYVCSGWGSQLITFNPPNLAVAQPPSVSKPVFRPSFECNDDSLNETERTICQTAELSHLDNQMSELYRLLLIKYPNAADVSKARLDQHHFIDQRNACGPSVSCIASLYSAREAEIRSMGIYENVNIDEGD